MLLDRYLDCGPSSGDRRAAEQVRAFVLRQPRCFDRTTAEGHITGSAWLLDEPRERCLLTHHRKLGRWLQLGGHCDGDPDVLRVARREAVEESGIEGIRPLSREIFDVDVHRIPACGSEAAHLHFDVRFAFVAPAGARFRVSDESHDLAWVRRDEVTRYEVDASVARMATKWAPPTLDVSPP